MSNIGHVKNTFFGDDMNIDAIEDEPEVQKMTSRAPPIKVRRVAPPRRFSFRCPDLDLHHNCNVMYVNGMTAYIINKNTPRNPRKLSYPVAPVPIIGQVSPSRTKKKKQKRSVHC